MPRFIMFVWVASPYASKCGRGQSRLQEDVPHLRPRHQPVHIAVGLSEQLVILSLITRRHNPLESHRKKLDRIVKSKIFPKRSSGILWCHLLLSLNSQYPSNKGHWISGAGVLGAGRAQKCKRSNRKMFYVLQQMSKLFKAIEISN